MGLGRLSSHRRRKRCTWKVTITWTIWQLILGASLMCLLYLGASAHVTFVTRFGRTRRLPICHLWLTGPVQSWSSWEIRNWLWRREPTVHAFPCTSPTQGLCSCWLGGSSCCGLWFLCCLATMIAISHRRSVINSIWYILDFRVICSVLRFVREECQGEAQHLLLVSTVGLDIASDVCYFNLLVVQGCIYCPWRRTSSKMCWQRTLILHNNAAIQTPCTALALAIYSWPRKIERKIRRFFMCREESIPNQRNVRFSACVVGVCLAL